MTCRDVRAWLDLEGLGLLDDALDEPADDARARVREHAEGCPACAARLGELGGVREVLAAPAPLEPLPPELRARVTGAPPRRRGVGGALGVAIAAAAVALLALTLGRRGDPQPPAPLPVDVPGSDTPPAPVPAWESAPGAIFYTTPPPDLERLQARPDRPPAPARAARHPADPAEGADAHEAAADALPVGK